MQGCHGARPAGIRAPQAAPHAGELEGNVADPRGQGCRAPNAKLTSLDLCPGETGQELQKRLEQESSVGARVYPTHCGAVVGVARAGDMEAESRGPGACVAGQVLCTSLQGDRTWGWGPGTQEDGHSQSSGLPRLASQALSAQGGLCLKGKMVLGRHHGLARGRATYPGALLMPCIIKLFLGNLGERHE